MIEYLRPAYTMRTPEIYNDDMETNNPFDDLTGNDVTATFTEGSTADQIFESPGVLGIVAILCIAVVLWCLRLLCRRKRHRYDVPTTELLSIPAIEPAPAESSDMLEVIEIPPAPLPPPIVPSIVPIEVFSDARSDLMEQIRAIYALRNKNSLGSESTKC